MLCTSVDAANSCAACAEAGSAMSGTNSVDDASSSGWSSISEAVGNNNTVVYVGRRQEIRELRRGSAPTGGSGFVVCTNTWVGGTSC